MELLADLDDERLDVFVSRRLPGTSRSHVRKLIDSGLVRVEGSLERPSYRLHFGELIAVHPAEAAPAPVPVAIDLDVIFEDEHLVVLNKAAGLTVHPAPGERDTTLTSALVSRWPQLAQLDDTLRAGLVHRLDRDTTGLLMVAKTEAALAALQQQLRERSVEKKYLAVVAGVPDPEVGLIDAPLGRDPADPRRMAVVDRGRSSRTGYRLLERFVDAALLECDLITGRTHQIRVHLAAIGHPIAGDGTYGIRCNDIKRQALHARSITFTHPHHGESVDFSVDPPDDFRGLVERLRGGAILLDTPTNSPRPRRPRDPNRTNDAGASVSDKPVRVRYGPSPTGEPHIGNIRTALFDWLLARRHGGQFIVRIEDTDQSRRVEGAEAQILDALRWLGLDWDEGPDIGGPHAPYRQSERLPLYRAAADTLLESGAAYRCFCSPDRLDAVRKAQQQQKLPPGYDRHCRGLTPEAVDIAAAAHGPGVVRFAMPHAGVTVVDDALRGPVEFRNDLLDDHVLLKRDGFPTYHLASIVDDREMEISHVIRGEEWLPSAPRHVAQYAALGWPAPIWVHVPIIRGPDKGKLSKRHGATSLRAYGEEGYLPEALLNFMALLGWSKDESTTIMSRDEIRDAFSIEGLGLASAMFDVERLREMNARYIRNLAADDFLERGRPWLEAAIGRPLDLARLLPLAGAIQERVKLLPEIVDYADFFYVAGPLDYANAELMGRGYRGKPWAALEAVEAVLSTMRSLEPWTAEAIEAALRTLAEQRGEKPGVLFTPIRVATTGKRIAPPLFDTLEVLGRETTLERLNAAAEHLARPDD